MKKRAESLIEENTAISISESQEMAQVIRIRTETAISQYPFHRLSKSREPIQIAIVTQGKRGKVSTQWEVSANRKYGEPGILAYKLDTLLINRLIDEMRPDVPEILKLGSLHEICRELGITEGRNKEKIKKALHQNASAYITANLFFQGNDGAERKFEFGATRYEVIFYGEKLPDGRRADAVYIIFHRSYYEMLKQARTRPLDYAYLKALPPASQRLYELISYQIFAAIKNGNPRAKYLYSELCLRAPLTRYQDWEHVKKQLYKVHQPHKASGYISKVEFQETTDASGVIDWVMWYTPGRKAKAEFKRFNTKEGRELDKQQRATRPHLVSVQLLKPATIEAETIISAEDKAIIEKLTSHGIDESRAARLVEDDRAECELWVNAWPYQNQKGMDNPPAVLVSFIEKKRRPIPKGYKEAKEREERHRQHEQEQARQRAGENYFQFFEPQFRAHQEAELKAIEEQHPEEYAAFKAHFDKVHAKGARMITGKQQRERYTLRSASEYFNELQPELGLRLSTFDEWDEQHNAESCDPLEWFNRDPQRIFEELERRYREL